MAGIGQKKRQLEKWVKGSWEWNPTWANHNKKNSHVYFFLYTPFILI